MNATTTEMIRDACESARSERGLRLIRGGAWFEWDETKIIATDPIGAVLLHVGALPEGLDPEKPETMVRPRLIEAAQRVLEVDHFWLYRFWMGYDRNYQILYHNEEKKTYTKDSVSEFGIALSRELFR